MDRYERNHGKFGMLVKTATQWRDKWAEADSKMEAVAEYSKFLADMHASESPEFVRGIVTGFAMLLQLMNPEDYVQASAGMAALEYFIKDYDPFKESDEASNNGD